MKHRPEHNNDTYALTLHSSSVAVSRKPLCTLQLDSPLKCAHECEVSSYSFTPFHQDPRCITAANRDVAAKPNTRKPPPSNPEMDRIKAAFARFIHDERVPTFRFGAHEGLDSAATVLHSRSLQAHSLQARLSVPCTPVYFTPASPRAMMSLSSCLHAMAACSCAQAAPLSRGTRSVGARCCGRASVGS